MFQVVSQVGSDYFLVDVVSLPGCEEGPGLCALLLTVVSLLLILLALPLSLVCVVKVVQVVH